MDEKQLKTGEIFKARYEIKSLIARGGMGTTYLAMDKERNIDVVLKVLAFSEIGNWKVLELFEREIDVLKNLNHPLIPDYIDNFRIEKGKETLFILVQNYVKGSNLEELIKKGKRFNVKQVISMFKDLLNVLNYIHNIQPAIIHRDINPRNIILGSDGKTYLVDFNASGHVAKSTQAASTTYVGSFGYMAQEQLYGKAYPATDLYALAITIIYVLTHKHPSDFPLKNMKIDFEPYININMSIKNLLHRMIEPDVSKRVQSAQEAIDILNGKLPIIEHYQDKKIKENKKQTDFSEKTISRLRSFSRILLYIIGIIISIIIIVFLINSISKVKDVVRPQRKTITPIVQFEKTNQVQKFRPVEFKDASISKINISPDGKYLAAAGSADVIIIWEIKTGNIVKRLYGHRRSVYNLEFSSDGKKLVSIGEDFKVIIWNLETGNIIKTINIKRSSFKSYTVSKDLKYLANFYSYGKLTIIDIENENIVFDREINRKVNSNLIFSNNGKYLAWSTGQSGFIYDIIQNQTYEIPPIDQKKFTTQLLFTPDNNYLAIGYTNNQIVLYSVKDKNFVISLPKGKVIRYISFFTFSPDNKLIAINQSSTIIICDVETGSQKKLIKNDQGVYHMIKAFAFSNDNNYIFLDQENHTVRMVNLKTGITEKIFIP